MKKDLEVITIDDKDYAVIKEVSHESNTYLYLSNILDEEDTLIRKIDKNDKDLVIPLESDQEFEIACNLLLKFITN